MRGIPTRVATKICDRKLRTALVLSIILHVGGDNILESCIAFGLQLQDKCADRVDSHILELDAADLLAGELHSLVGAISDESVGHLNCRPQKRKSGIDQQ